MQWAIQDPGMMKADWMGDRQPQEGGIGPPTVNKSAGAPACREGSTETRYSGEINFLECLPEGTRASFMAARVSSRLRSATQSPMICRADLVRGRHASGICSDDEQHPALHLELGQKSLSAASTL